ncbi:hypothetical protein BVRB_1g002160 [Beta vulgaris subsp. vulgaris]|nr:hypothetical protein BVRB_1g002160 [Beta vulgaris subsp. vulgaris]
MISVSEQCYQGERFQISSTVVCSSKLVVFVLLGILLLWGGRGSLQRSSACVIEPCSAHQHV